MKKTPLRRTPAKPKPQTFQPYEQPSSRPIFGYSHPGTV